MTKAKRVQPQRKPPKRKVAKKKAPKKKSATRKKGIGILDRIEGIDESSTDTLLINVYGRSGTGKTTFACTFPKPLLIVGTEKGTKSVHNVEGVDFVRLKTATEMFELVDAIPELGYKTVVLDQATGLQDLVSKEVLELDELPAQRSWGMASQQDWGRIALQTKTVLRAFMSLEDVHRVIIAQEREFNTDNENEMIMPYVASALSPSVVGWLNPACDYIVQTFIRQQTIAKKVKVRGKTVTRQVQGKGVDYCLRTAPSAVFTTKFRLPKGFKLPDEITDPDFDKLSKIIQQGG